MPDPVLYLKSTSAAAIVSAILALAMLAVSKLAARRSAGRNSLDADAAKSNTVTGSSHSKTPDLSWLNCVYVISIAAGLATGYCVLSLVRSWPPVNALDRFLMIVIPVTLAVELVSGVSQMPRWFAWLLRLVIAAAVPRILLHDSVYLGESDGAWSGAQTGVTLVVCAALLASVWALLSWLYERSPGVSIPLSLAVAIQCGGLTIMMAGYIKGGAAAFPLAVVLGTVAIVVGLICKRCPAGALLGCGVVGLFGLLFIGRFFGRLSTESACVLLLVPLICWVSELPILRNQKSWIVGVIRLAFVAIPLIVVLVLAKFAFDRDMAPLLGDGPPVQQQLGDATSEKLG